MIQNQTRPNRNHKNKETDHEFREQKPPEREKAHCDQSRIIDHHPPGDRRHQPREDRAAGAAHRRPERHGQGSDPGVLRRHRGRKTGHRLQGKGQESCGKAGLRGHRPGAADDGLPAPLRGVQHDCGTDPADPVYFPPGGSTDQCPEYL